MKKLPKQLESLRWYLERSNHGRGRICGDTRKMLDAGYLTIAWTGMKSWTLTISNKGRAALLADDDPMEANERLADYE